MSVIEIRMLQWMSGVIRKDSIRNKYFRGSIGVASILDKIRDMTLRWLDM